MTHYLLAGIENRLTANLDPGDTHDYSSSGYNGYDDGYISAVYDTISAIEDLISQGKLVWAGDES